jgi:hypothetical protein
MDLFSDIATFKGFTGKEVKGYVTFKKSYPIDEIEISSFLYTNKYIRILETPWDSEDFGKILQMFSNSRSYRISFESNGRMLHVEAVGYSRRPRIFDKWIEGEDCKSDLQATISNEQGQLCECRNQFQVFANSAMRIYYG